MPPPNRIFLFLQVRPKNFARTTAVPRDSVHSRNTLRPTRLLISLAPRTERLRPSSALLSSVARPRCACLEETSALFFGHHCLVPSETGTFRPPGRPLT